MTMVEPTDSTMAMKETSSFSEPMVMKRMPSGRSFLRLGSSASTRFNSLLCSSLSTNWAVSEA
jgi:hypothetical protein